MNPCWVIVLLFTAETFCESNHTIAPEKTPKLHGNDWWSNTILYQVYPLSFQDSNGDGIGDIKGIIQRLDHFIDLGIETLWIGPLFKSPMNDMGYDVEDYKLIDPIFGTMEDFDNLISEMNKRNLKLITDFIPNHSSYKCEWFQKSIKREGKYENYYIWRNATNQQIVLNNPSVEPIVPNNWMSIFGNSSWTWNNERKQFYFHHFSVKQPDLNLRNTDVQQELLDVLEFWMDKGVAGFRFDALKFMFKHESFENEPNIEGKENSTKFQDLKHIYTLDQPEVFQQINKWRTFMDEYSKRKNTLPRLMATESYTDIRILMKYYGNSSNPGAQVPFNFGFIESIDNNNMINSIDKSIRNWMEITPQNSVANWVLENHDRPRIPQRFSPQMVQVLTALKHILPGIDVTYYGGEIGMENTVIRPDQVKDPNIDTAEPVYRDEERTPMQWDSSINAGFTKAKKPWLPVNPNYYKLNVQNQKKLPTSNYNFYKNMSQLRKTNTLKYGDLQTFQITQSIYILKRSLSGHESYLAVMNVGSETEPVILSDVINNLNDTLYVYLGSENTDYSKGSIVSSNSGGDHPLVLRPQSVVVLTDKKMSSSSHVWRAHYIYIISVLLFHSFS